MSKIIFITGLGSGVGKTHATGWRARSLMLDGSKVITQKFIQTGADKAVDVMRHRELMGIPVSADDRDGTTSPVIIDAPGDPLLASATKGANINLHDIDRATRQLKKRCDVLLIEGTGGLMSPITPDIMQIDYIQNRNLPVVFVTNGSPGSLSHTILALDTLRRRNVRLEEVVYNSYFDAENPALAEYTLRFLRSYVAHTFRHVPVSVLESITPARLSEAEKPKQPVPSRQLSISKLQLAELPQVTYPGTITVVDTPEECVEAISRLSRYKIVGFDTETRPSFRKGKMYPPALVQISTARRCYLFRINKIGLHPALRAFLEKESIKKVGLSLRDDYHALRRKDPEFEPAGFIDLQTYVRDFDIADLSLQKIYGIIFERRISKNQRLSNWEAPTLSEAQQIYAAIDAWASLRIYRHLESGKFDPPTSRFVNTTNPPE